MRVSNADPKGSPELAAPSLTGGGSRRYARPSGTSALISLTTGGADILREIRRPFDARPAVGLGLDVCEGAVGDEPGDRRYRQARDTLRIVAQLRIEVTIHPERREAVHKGPRRHNATPHVL